MLYVYSCDEYILSSIVSWGDRTINMNDDGLIKDESCIIVRSLLGWEASQEHKDHAFLYVAVMFRESSRSELVQDIHAKSGGISMITFTFSTG